MDEFGGDLAGVLKLPSQKAKKALMQFPMIGEPGAEKILMFSGQLDVLALESNGLRVLGVSRRGEDRKSQTATYKSVREVTLEELPADSKLLTAAHLLLRAAWPGVVPSKRARVPGLPGQPGLPVLPAGKMT